MDVDALRAHAQTVMFATIGVPILVLRPEVGAVAVETRGVWTAAPLDEQRPTGTDWSRHEPRRVLVIPRGGDVPELIRGTQILAAETQGGTEKNWRVDGIEQSIQVDEIRAIVVLNRTP